MLPNNDRRCCGLSWSLGIVLCAVKSKPDNCWQSGGVQKASGSTTRDVMSLYNVDVTDTYSMYIRKHLFTRFMALKNNFLFI